MKLTGLENSNPDTVAGARMLVAHTAWDCSGVHPLGPALSYPSGHAPEWCAGATARTYRPRAMPAYCRHRAPH
jgi:hypothetical protein